MADDDNTNAEPMAIDEDLEDEDDDNDALLENEVDEEEDEGEEDEDNENYNLKFYGEMDPLDFALKDSSNGDEIYQQFERLEYEALAERKRKALIDPQNRGEQAKKTREEEDAAMEVINEFMSLGRRRRRRRSRGDKKRGRRKGSKNNLNPEVERKIGDANLKFASGNYDEVGPCYPVYLLKIR